MDIDTIQIVIQGSRCDAFGNLIRAALEGGAKDFPISTHRNLMENTHVEIVQDHTPPLMT